jgi:hypothetical protein
MYVSYGSFPILSIMLDKKNIYTGTSRYGSNSTMKRRRGMGSSNSALYSITLNFGGGGGFKVTVLEKKISLSQGLYCQGQPQKPQEHVLSRIWTRDSSIYDVQNCTARLKMEAFIPMSPLKNNFLF